MENALIVSTSEQSVAFFTEMLNAAGFGAVTVLRTGAEARRLFPERDFDIVVIYAPLTDETGENLSRFVTSHETAQAILVVKGEYFDEISAAAEDDGILVVSSPVDRTVFWATLKFAKSAQNRLKKVWAENTRLKKKIEDIRIVDRAKCLLISYLNMNEKEAHRFIEKQAMDIRESKRSIAELILSTYDS